MNQASSAQNRFVNWKTLLGILVSLLGLYLGFRKFDAAEFRHSLQDTSLRLFILAMAVMVLQVLLRSMRWRYLILPLKTVPLKDVFGAQMVTYFGNHVFPLRFGEILRSYALNRSSGLPIVSIFGTVVIERLLDLIFFMILLPLTILVYAPVWPEWIRLSGIAAAGAMLVLILLLLFFRKRREQLKRFIDRKMALSRHQKWVVPIRRFLDGLSTLRSTPYLKQIGFMTLVVWTVSILNVWVAGLAVGVFFSFQNLLLLFFVTSAIIAVPSAPGYVGTYHAGAIGILLYMGYELSQAQVIAVILHAVGFISLTVIGFSYFLKYHIHVREARADRELNRELGV